MKEDNEWRPISEATKEAIEKLKPKPFSYRGRPNPIFDQRKSAFGWNQRRFVLAYGKWEISIMWVDDDGTCPKHHIPYDDGSRPLGWHEYQNGKGQVWALACPASLSPKLVDRISVDVPPGHAINMLRDARANRKEHDRQENIERVRQEDME